ncbi:16S rRNA (adenine(1518)-N(6)/adenine(1519)-N(6))-dimethyltransferase RsmA [Komagataeibacter rhaeticus]|uniref:16S rRNA (adenine(1518)-N(6)/adenine(1519)-N(6))- dimethyltransferase RsmA n=1 Tax=Komagataeibacter rhaeticus TaxID=215221 RepID=UPI0039EB8B30
MTIPTPPPGPEPLRETIARHGLDARKALGQHFLLDPGITARIAGLAGDLAGQNVVEVGPGPGGLTRALLDSEAGRVVAVEVDTRAVAIITELASRAGGRLEVIEADAMRLDLTTLCPAPRQVIANLPYNVGTPLLVGWLRQAAAWTRLTLMFQQEVAERICAAPGSAHYGRLGVLAQWTCRCGVLMHIPPGAFSPPPRVHSAVVGLIPHAHQPDAALFRAMEQVTAAAFGPRRKLLRGARQPLGGESRLAAAGIDGRRRAETLDIAEFDRLARLHMRRAAA